MTLRILLATILMTAAVACKSPPAAEPGDSPALTRAKAMVDQTARDFEALTAQAQGAQTDPEQLRALGERLRRGLESHRTEGEALNKQLTDDEKQGLKAFGVRRLVPAVRALEAKLGTTADPPSLAAPEPATAVAR